MRKTVTNNEFASLKRFIKRIRNNKTARFRLQNSDVVVEKIGNNYLCIVKTS